MAKELVAFCQSYPQLVVFLTLALGYSVGKVKFHGFSLGATTGCLLVALVLGQVGIAVPELLKSIGFALFIFAVGYRVGPQFFGGLNRKALNYLWLSIVVAVTGLASAVCLGKLFGFDQGTTAGLLAGAMTQSAAIGTAEGAIRHLAVSSVQQATLENNVAIAYAITYVFGTGGLIVFFKLLPKLLKVDLKTQARTLESEMSGGVGAEDSPALFSWYKRIGLRAYQVTNAAIVGSTVGALESMFSERVSVEKLKRGQQVFEPDPDTILARGDVFSMAGHHHGFLDAERLIGPEVDAPRVLDLVGEVLDVCVTKPEAVGRTLGALSREHGHGLFLRRITRQGHELPLARDLEVHRCDVLQLTGARDDVERAVPLLGYPERPAVTTDLTMVSLGIILGTLLGLLAVPVMGIPITLGVGGGVLVSGLVFGWLRSIHPTFGAMPGPAQWIFTDLGLNLFITCVGLSAGVEAVHALKQAGLSIFLSGILVTLLPACAGLIFGRMVLKLDHVLLFGALTGAETCTAALNAVKEDADSDLPVIGYTLTFAFNNVLLTVWGTVIVNLM